MTLSVRHRISAAFLAALAVATGVGALAVGAVSGVGARLHEVASEKLPLVQAADTLNISTEVELRSLGPQLHDGVTDPQIRAKLFEDAEVSRKDAAAAIAAFEALPHTPEIEAIWAQLRRNADAYGVHASELGEALRREEGGAESRAAARERHFPLSSQAAGLATLVGRFELGDGGADARWPGSRPRPARPVPVSAVAERRCP